MTDDANLYLEPNRRRIWGVPLPRRWWWLILGIAGLLLLAAGGLVLVLGAGYLLQEPVVEALPTMTLVPTFTPRPMVTKGPAAVTLTVRPWSGNHGPLGLVEVILFLPAPAQVRSEVSPERNERPTRTASHEPPPGFRYWSGDLLRTRQGLGWSGAGGSEVRWYLLREPGTAFPASLQVTVDGQPLAITLQAATPATTSVPVE